MKFLLILSVAFLFSSCSEDNQDASVTSDYFNFTASGTTVKVDYTGNDDSITRGYVSQIGEVFQITIFSGMHSSGSYDRQHRWVINFDKDGTVISAVWSGISDSSIRYRNYKHFPANYFNVEILSLDDTQQRIKLNFNGTLYKNWESMTSEPAFISGDLNLHYEVLPALNSEITTYSIEQYCRASFNGVPWKAYFEHSYSVFTSFDPYKIEIGFAATTLPGTYSFNSESTENYLRFSKFNTQTLVYDNYNVSGNIAYSYKEHHGSNYYSFIGTYDFTATNSNNPNDVIQVTNGVFRSFQQY